MTPTIPPSFVRLSDGAYPIPHWHHPDPSAHAEVFMDAPPEVPPGFVAELADQPDEYNILRYSLRPIDLGERRAARLAELAERRYRVEVGGTIWNGWPVNTDRDSQGKAGGLFLSVLAGIRAEGAAWKFADGEARPLANADAQALAATIARHVQAAFEREAVLAAEIRASADPQSVDIATGWPATA